MPVGVACTVAICLGIPLLSFLVVHSHRQALDTVHVAQTYGFIYRRYRYGRTARVHASVRAGASCVGRLLVYVGGGR